MKRFTWKRILQDALWDDGNRILSLLVWTNPCSILTFMEYNPNVMLLTACSHYVINYLHKFSCPPENSFWPGSPESKQGVPLWVSAHVPYTVPACHAHCPAHAASASSWDLRGVLHTLYAWLITWWRCDMRMDMRDGSDLFFLKHYDLTARVFFILFSWIAGSANPVLIHTALTSRIISVSDCKM